MILLQLDKGQLLLPHLLLVCVRMHLFPWLLSDSCPLSHPSPSFFFYSSLAAYKHADGKKIDGRRVLVDVERGRTVKGWRPRRLGHLLFTYFNLRPF